MRNPAKYASFYKKLVGIIKNIQANESLREPFLKKDYKLFLSNLVAFKGELGLDDDEIDWISEYTNKGKDIVENIPKKLEKVQEDILSLSTEAVFDDLKEVIADFQCIAPFEQVFETKVFEQIQSRLDQILSTLKTTHYDSQKLEALQSQLAVITGAPTKGK